ncbi:MAG: DinB family protein [Gemmataceae bacterium]
MDATKLIDEYLAGPELIRQAIAGMTPEQVDAAPVPGKWSTRQVVCHLADYEPVYADRIKRVIAEDNPTLINGDPNLFAANLAYDARNLDEEIHLIEVVRNHLARILRTLPPETFQRTGTHTRDGALTAFQLLERITNHIPHHLKFVADKRAALGA